MHGYNIIISFILVSYYAKTKNKCVNIKILDSGTLSSWKQLTIGPVVSSFIPSIVSLRLWQERQLDPNMAKVPCLFI